MNNFLRMTLALFLAVLILPSVVVAKDDKPQGPDSVMAFIESRRELSKFADMIKEAGLAKELESKGQIFTIFAPNNDAIGDIPSDVSKRLKDKAALQSFVNYHIVGGSQILSTTIQYRRSSPAAMNSESLSFPGNGKDLKVNEATLVIYDQMAPNGVVHIANAPIVPPSLKEQPAHAAPQSAKDEEMAPAPVKVEEKTPLLTKTPVQEQVKTEPPAKAEEKPAAVPADRKTASESSNAVKGKTEAKDAKSAKAGKTSSEKKDSSKQATDAKTSDKATAADKALPKAEATAPAASAPAPVAPVPTTTDKAPKKEEKRMFKKLFSW